MNAAQGLICEHDVPVSKACQALDLPRATFYRHQRPPAQPVASDGKRAVHPRSLTPEERARVLNTLYQPEFVDRSPYQVYAELLDAGRHLCSVSTMYRILRAVGSVKERRDQLRHPAYAVPRLQASAPNQVWTWDITKLPGPQKWKSYYLYVILDMYSRCVVGFLVAEVETSALAKQLIEESCQKQRIEAKQLVLHADRGAQMTSKTVSQLLWDLGVEQSHSRPRVSNDNAFSEAQFKTVKTRADYPSYFSSVEDARQWSRTTLEWYNHEHHHEALGWMTPYQVHYGLAEQLRLKRQETLDAALAAHPERFVTGRVKAPGPPKLVSLNPLPLASSSAPSPAPEH
jgi:putative transposase